MPRGVRFERPRFTQPSVGRSPGRGKIDANPYRQLRQVGNFVARRRVQATQAAGRTDRASAVGCRRRSCAKRMRRQTGRRQQGLKPSHVRWDCTRTEESAAPSKRQNPHEIQISCGFGRWWPGAESNHRHKDFQSTVQPSDINNLSIYVSTNDSCLFAYALSVGSSWIDLCRKPNGMQTELSLSHMRVHAAMRRSLCATSLFSFSRVRHKTL